MGTVTIKTVNPYVGRYPTLGVTDIQINNDRILRHLTYPSGKEERKYFKESLQTFMDS